MTNVVRRDDPFELFDNMFSKVFRPMMFEATRSLHPNGDAETIAMDVAETDHVYRMSVDLPGVKKEDINVAIDGNRVTLSAETRREKAVGDEKERWLLTERGAGRLYRSIQLAHEIDEQAAQAKYQDGVLELTLPKKEPIRTKRLEVH